MKNSEKYKNYIHIGTSDKDALADLVMKAKGPKRSMRRFAEDIGVNPSTLSRIINKKTCGSNTIEIIIKIAENADPDSGVTTEMLLIANGMVLQDNLNKTENIKKLRNSVLGIVVNELYSRGYSVSHVYQTPPYTILNSVLGKCYIDFCVESNALGIENSIWVFDILTTIHRNELNKEASIDRIRQWILMYVGMIAFNEDKINKISILFPEKDVYYSILEYVKGFHLHNAFSLIYIDIENSCIGEEYIIKDSQESIVFKLNDTDQCNDNDEFENRIVYDISTQFYD